MKSIIISIHPQHVEKILSGEKVFEYRKSLPKEKISDAVIYATAPISRIVAVANVENMLQASPSKLWEMTKSSSGISRSFYREYFHGRHKACAIHLGQIFQVSSPIHPRDESYKIHVPQSYAYLQNDKLSKIKTLTSEAVAGKKLFFLGGIHGCGKSTISSEVLSSFGFQCKSASSIIKKSGGEVNKDKKTDRIMNNQDLLIKGLNDLRNRNSRLLIDGHYCLISKDGNIEEIPLEVFEEMSPSAICVLTAPAKVIASRLMERDNKEYDLKLLGEMQARETQHAKLIAQKLALPFLQLNSMDKPRRNSEKFKNLLY